MLIVQPRKFHDSVVKVDRETFLQYTKCHFSRLQISPNQITQKPKTRNQKQKIKVKLETCHLHHQTFDRQIPKLLSTLQKFEIRNCPTVYSYSYTLFNSISSALLLQQQSCSQIRTDIKTTARSTETQHSLSYLFINVGACSQRRLYN